MIRWSMGVAFVALVSHAASASDVLPTGVAPKPPADTHCAALGEGFFAVAGSNACIRISGRISAGAVYGAGAGSIGVFGPRPGASVSGFDGQAAASGDLRFETPAGPARVYVGVRRDIDPRGLVGD